MRGDDSSRNRAILLARWRGAAGRVRPAASSPSSPRASIVAEEAPTTAQDDAASEPAASSSTFPVAAPVAALPPSKPEAPLNEAALFRRFEEEIQRVVPRPTAEVLCRLLAAPRDALLRERSEENRAQMLAQLDLIEDVLDAVLLAGAASADQGGQGSA